MSALTDESLHLVKVYMFVTDEGRACGDSFDCLGHNLNGLVTMEFSFGINVGEDAVGAENSSFLKFGC